MGHEALQQFLATDVDRIIGVRENYVEWARKKVAKTGKENTDLLQDDAIYRNWINFAPYFFRGVMRPYTKLMELGYQPNDLAKFLGNKFRVPRYFTELLLPGAFLDRNISEGDKFAFLENFSQSARQVIKGKSYHDLDYQTLLSLSPISEQKRRVIGQFIGTVKEACESVYFGQQARGYPEFGLDKKGLPDDYIIYHSFDLNLGSRQFPEIGKIDTISLYPKESYPRYEISFNTTYVHIFYYRYLGEEKWTNGPPPIDILSGGGIFLEGRQLTVSEISNLTSALLEVISKVERNRKTMSDLEFNLEYCSDQSTVIRNLYGLLGKKWKLPELAKQSIISNLLVEKLKKDLGHQHTFELVLDLIKKSHNWAGQVL